MLYDVVVVGGGCAAICAALSASERGARVIVLERAPKEHRGGNSMFATGGFRIVHHGAADIKNAARLFSENSAAVLPNRNQFALISRKLFPAYTRPEVTKSTPLISIETFVSS